MATGITAPQKGQQVSTGSQSVVIASDQSPVPIGISPLSVI